MKEYSPERVAEWTGIAAGDIRKLAREYATERPSVIRLNYGVQRSEGGGMAKGYWITFYHSISNPAALAEYGKLAEAAIVEGGGRFLARGMPALVSAFVNAASGMLGFEVALPTLLTLVRAGALPLDMVIERLTAVPARVLGRALPAGAGTLAVGAPADVTVFDPAARWTVTPEALRSTSKNTPLLGLEVQGAVRLTVVGGDVRYRA